MTHYIIVESIYLGSDLLCFSCVNHFIILGWLRLFRMNLKLNKSHHSSLEFVEVRTHVIGQLSF